MIFISLLDVGKNNFNKLSSAEYQLRKVLFNVNQYVGNKLSVGRGKVNIGTEYLVAAMVTLLQA